jgi:hypothetical protein
MDPNNIDAIQSMNPRQIALFANQIFLLIVTDSVVDSQKFAK